MTRRILRTMKRPEGKKGRAETSAKARIRDVLAHQSDEASYDDLLREIAFRRVVDRGVADVDEGRTMDTDRLLERIRTWDD